MQKFTRNPYRNDRVHFKKFSRRKFAILATMHKEVIISTLVACYSLLVLPGKSQSTKDSIDVTGIIKIDEIEVSPLESPEMVVAVEPAVMVVNQSQIKSSAHSDIHGLLQSSSGIDIRQRGSQGIQSDISYRGGTFDQTKVTLNGIPLSDPQTGHFSLSLPITLQSIYKTEIFSSAGSRYLAINSSSGTLNLLAKPDSTTNAKLNLSYGDNNFVQAKIKANLVLSNSKHLVTGSYTQSDGYAENTDFKKGNFFYLGTIETSQLSSINILYGYDNKAFGANGFYTPLYPDQYEQNTLNIGAITFSHQGMAKIKASAYVRRHTDRFELFRESKFNYVNGFYIHNQDTASYAPGIYYPGHNHHINTTTGAKVNSTFNNRLGTTYIGAHVNNSQIISNNIGDAIYDTLPVRNYLANYTKSYQRSNFNAFLAHQVNFQKLSLQANLITNYNNEQAEKINLLPGAGLQYKISDKLGLSSDYAYVMEQPTFTDLFYRDPSNVGNRDLKTYYLHVIDLKLSYFNNIVRFNIGPFVKYGENIIDWVWFIESNRFNPVHLEEATYIGGESNIYLSFENLPFGRYVSWLSLSYSGLTVDKTTQHSISKYNHISNKLVINSNHSITKPWSVSWQAIFQNREGGYFNYNSDLNEYVLNDYAPLFLFNIKTSYSYKFMEISVNVTNLFNTKYIEQGSVHQPGRLIKSTISFKF